MSEEEVVFNLELNVEPALANVRQVEGLIFRTLGYIQRLGLPADINHAIRIVQQMTMAIRLMHSAMIALEAASGPIGWWRAALGMAGAGFAVAGVAQSMNYETRGT